MLGLRQDSPEARALPPGVLRCLHRCRRGDAVAARRGAADRANDLRAQATVESELPGGHRNCHKYQMSYSTPEGRSRSVAMCSKYDELAVGQSVTVRYSPEDPIGHIVLDGEDSLTVVLFAPGAALGFAVGVTGSWFAWRRPESLLRLGLRF
ncbi:DUF3592 domain-containing protein [Actinosynnema sp. NPDC049800]